jgi:hypothetical protein
VDGGELITLSSPPPEDDLELISDILQATGRQVIEVNGKEIRSELPPDGDSTSNIRERISELFCCKSSRGKTVGELTTADISLELQGPQITVKLPDGTSKTDLDRLDNVMLAYGRIRD